DIDHYGGLMGALDNYSVKNVIKTDAFKEGKEWKIFEEKIKNENASEIKSVCGMELIFSNGAKFQVVYPLEGNIVSNDSNNYSVVTKMDFGENSFLFTGDIERETENILINSGIRLDADFLKVSHHGSKSSSSDEFLDAVSPEDAIISAGAGNPYNHPHKETLKKLENRLVRIWRTDKEGRIIYKCRNKNEKCRAFAD
ncbi:MAG: MBL fold metallo-hydrolase, partial [Parcubacteria group bacterium]